MVTHSSATARQETSHVNRTTRTATIMNALKQRAQTVLNDASLDDQSRATLRHALETKIRGWQNSCTVRCHSLRNKIYNLLPLTQSSGLNQQGDPNGSHRTHSGLLELHQRVRRTAQAGTR